MASRRLSPDVDWLEIQDHELSLPRLAGRLADCGENRLTFIFANAVYRSSIHQRVADWDGRGKALALISRNQPIGLFSLSAQGISELSAQPPSRIRSAQELLAWLFSSSFVHNELVSDTDWQRIRDHQDINEAERKLDQWLVKPTDGVFARFNRRISIPISHRLIKTRITPNMVSVFTLAVGFVSGLCFAMGEYLSALLGAALSVLASILDGCDGEVARLTFRESAFGCWLETVCDYLYYIFIFGGMAAGLVRHSPSQSYVWLTVLLFFGAIVSMLVTSYQRRTLASGQPERYLATWQGRVEKEQSLMLWVGRHTEFMIRRCFLPYALLAFALCNATRVAFVLCAFGANVVWPIALYSNRRLASPVHSRSNSSCYFQSAGRQ
jgi:phosphatidylglycerophosphate synthase